MSAFIYFLTIGYAANAIVASIAYLPQICRLLKDKSRSESFCTLSWMLWFWSSLVAFAYALFVNGDTVFIMVTGFGFAGTAAIWMIILINRLRDYADG